MNVVITSRTAETVEATAEEFRSVGIPVSQVAADLSTDEGIDAVFKATLDAFGTVDVLVNNAADLRRFRLADMPEGLADYQLLANIRAPYECSVRASEIMKRDQKPGSIVNISSVGGLRGHFRGLPYDVSKGAMDSMTKSMALDLCDFGIRVNAVAPGATINKSLVDEGNASPSRLARIPLRRLGTPLEMGAATAFLCSDDAAYIIGQVIYVDGGITTMLGTPEQPV
jgi:NAD(P)-dependent dehydrogenase (short-subunit alcohol dehydrogenase family)